MKTKPKTFKLILIRHGESLANLDSHLIGGRSPETILSSKGEIQAANLGKYFQKKFLETGENFDVIYSSPFAKFPFPKGVDAKRTGYSGFLSHSFANYF